MGTSGLVKSADRVLAVLDLLAREGPLSFAPHRRALEVPKSSAHNLLATITARGYVERDPELGVFALGIRVWEITQGQHRVERLRRALEALIQGLVTPRRRPSSWPRSRASRRSTCRSRSRPGP